MKTTVHIIASGPAGCGKTITLNHLASRLEGMGFVPKMKHRFEPQREGTIWEHDGVVKPPEDILPGQRIDPIGQHPTWKYRDPGPPPTPPSVSPWITDRLPTREDADADGHVLVPEQDREQTSTGWVREKVLVIQEGDAWAPGFNMPPYDPPTPTLLDTLMWLLENHHEGSGEFEDKIGQAIELAKKIQS